MIKEMGNQVEFQILDDGLGSAIIPWHGDRGSTKKIIYAQRVDINETGLGTANGTLVSNSNPS